jgi:hypothetical protein
VPPICRDGMSKVGGPLEPSCVRVYWHSATRNLIAAKIDEAHTTEKIMKRLQRFPRHAQRDIAGLGGATVLPLEPLPESPDPRPTGSPFS